MAKRKKKTGVKKVLLFCLIVLVLGVAVFFQTRPKLQVISVVSNIDNYGYYIESNATNIYKKYYTELEKELKNNEVDEEKYASLVGKLFIIDFYTLNNKVTNKDIGGIQFIHSSLKDNFINNASNTVYKYVKENLYGTRKQQLPVVKDVKINDIENIKYKENGYTDNAGYHINMEVSYKKDLDYPEHVELYLIHEDNKLVIVEMK